MPVTGPVIPRHYGSTGNSPTPAIGAPAPSGVSTFSGGGEIITCPRTGRMWIHRTAQAGPSGHTEAWVPVRFEFQETATIYGTSVAGIREWVTGSAPSGTNATGLELYGPTIKMQGDAGTVTAVDIVGSLSTDGLSVDSTNPILLNTSNPAANSIHLKSPDVSCSNSGHATGANFNWFTVRASVGCEFGDQGGVGDAYRMNARINGTKAQFERMIEANDGVRVTDLPNTYHLGTDSSGNLVNASVNNVDLNKNLASDTSIVIANTEEELGDLRTTLGTAGQTQIWMLTLNIGANHAGNHEIEFKLRNHTAATELFGARTSGSGYTCMSGCSVVTITAATQFRTYVKSTHTPVIKAQNSMAVPCTTFTAVRLA